MGQTVVFSSIWGCFDYSAVCCISAACGYPWTLGPNDRPDFYRAAFELILESFCRKKLHKIRNFQFILWMAAKFAWGAAKQSKTKYKKPNLHQVQNNRLQTTCVFVFLNCFHSKWIRYTLHIKETSNFIVGHFTYGSASMVVNAGVKIWTCCE